MKNEHEKAHKIMRSINWMFHNLNIEYSITLAGMLWNTYRDYRYERSTGRSLKRYEIVEHDIWHWIKHEPKQVEQAVWLFIKENKRIRIHNKFRKLTIGTFMYLASKQFPFALYVFENGDCSNHVDEFELCEVIGMERPVFDSWKTT
ncbi:hypothetical protein ACN08P_18980 [Photobacterium leiognathi subsp. mandapamensis]|uniref:hypothetical protein n=1 Tax=Photobacterium leiognathi TaxID=553611 RepID=UPI003AF34C48